MKAKHNSVLNRGKPEIVPLGSIDEYLAQKVLEGDGQTLRVRLSLDYNTGYLNIFDVSFEETEYTEGIDFELSTCECRGLDDMNSSDFDGKTVYTSSAYEFFEFYLDERDSVNCYVRLNNDSWIIKLC